MLSTLRQKDLWSFLAKCRTAKKYLSSETDATDVAHRFPVDPAAAGVQGELQQEGEAPSINAALKSHIPPNNQAAPASSPSTFKMTESR
jgi:hypothetical protein